MSHQKTIAFFTGYYVPHLGGIEIYTKALATELKKMGYRIIVVTSNSDSLRNIEKGEFYIYRLPIHKLFRNRYPVIHKNREYRQLIDAILHEKIDYVICNTRFYLTTLIGVKIAEQKRVPTLLIEHGSHHYSVGNKVLDFFGALYEHALTAIIKSKVEKFYGVSKACNQWLKHFGIQAKEIFYNSIDDKEYETFRHQHFLRKTPKIVINYTGRILPEKGVEELLRAYLNIVDDFPDSLLTIAGDGPMLARLKRKYQHQNIKFFGRLSHNQVMTLYNDTDVLVYPSMYPEGLPTAILEAGLMKCAVIATDMGGITEVIDDPKYGLLTTGNSKDIEKQLRKLLGNPETIATLKNNLHHKIVKQFDWSKTAQIVAHKIEETT